MSGSQVVMTRVVHCGESTRRTILPKGPRRRTLQYFLTLEMKSGFGNSEMVGFGDRAGERGPRDVPGNLNGGKYDTGLVLTL